jgi:hypothetical protein
MQFLGVIFDWLARQVVFSNLVALVASRKTQPLASSDASDIISLRI